MVEYEHTQGRLWQNPRKMKDSCTELYYVEGKRDNKLVTPANTNFRGSKSSDRIGQSIARKAAGRRGK